MNDRSVRNLAQLESSAATARVLNLRAIYRRSGELPEYSANPLFKNASLNRAIITKHRLRGNERDDFAFPRNSATKVIIPIDTSDLNTGAQYAFIGQKNFDEIISNTLNVSLLDLGPDLATLQVIDDTPSLDPFLLREQMLRQGIKPARCYFEISDADTARMFKFAQSEIEPLVRMSVGADGNVAFAATLARKLLADSADSSLEPLRLTMQMDRAQYQEGIFCWKAFLYYKWQLTDLLPKVSGVMVQIEKVSPRGQMNDDTRIYLAQTRTTLRRMIIAACQSVKETISFYDDAYAQLTKDSKPLAFRDFLLKAPEMFMALGERLGALDHIVSFWRYRFPSGRPPLITADDLVDLFMDFEQSLNFSDPVDTSMVKNVV
jgi:hypothetical protein